MKPDQFQLKEALSNVGIQIDDIFDLVNTPRPYPEAIPVLINLLKDGISHDGIKEGVVRALAVKEARGKAGKVLIEEFHKVPDEKSLLRWTIGNTIATVISEDDVPEVLNIVKNKNNGMARQMFVIALGNFQSQQIEQTLIELLSDDEVVAHALDALGKMKSVNAIEKIRSLLSHSKSHVKKEARKALKRIE
jgi:HEAT repeat protein